jgi:hypothetical protein
VFSLRYGPNSEMLLRRTPAYNVEFSKSSYPKNRISNFTRRYEHVPWGLDSILSILQFTSVYLKFSVIANHFTDGQRTRGPTS